MTKMTCFGCGQVRECNIMPDPTGGDYIIAICIYCQARAGLAVCSLCNATFPRGFTHPVGKDGNPLCHRCYEEVELVVKIIDKTMTLIKQITQIPEEEKVSQK